MPAQLDISQSAARPAIDMGALLSLRSEAAALTLGADPAVYRCDCGREFLAPVSTHVDCPGCGHDQPW